MVTYRLLVSPALNCRFLYDKGSIMRHITNLIIIVLLAVIIIRMGHLIDAYAESPISRQWIQQIPSFDCPVQAGGTIIINENAKEK